MSKGLWFIVLGIMLFGANCSREDPGEDRITIGVMPKLVGIDYFNACEKGALEAGVAVESGGPGLFDSLCCQEIAG